MYRGELVGAVGLKVDQHREFIAEIDSSWTEIIGVKE